MTLLAAAIVLFALFHLIPASPVLKHKLLDRFGSTYHAIFGIASLAALGLIIVGWRMAEFIPLYDPPVWGFYATFGFVLLAFLCLGIFIFRGLLRQILRLPLAVGVMCWGLGHLFSNGDWASLILFGGLALYGFSHLIMGLIYGYRPSPEVRDGHDVLSLLGGAALYGLVIQLHGIIIGVPVLQLK